MKAIAPTRNNAVRLSSDRRRENSAAEELRPQASHVSLSRSAPQFKQRVIVEPIPCPVIVSWYEAVDCLSIHPSSRRATSLPGPPDARPHSLLDTGRRRIGSISPYARWSEECPDTRCSRRDHLRASRSQSPARCG